MLRQAQHDGQREEGRARDGRDHADHEDERACAEEDAPSGVAHAQHQGQREGQAERERHAQGDRVLRRGLGAQRAETVRGFLVGLGVPSANVSTSSRGKLDAVGTDEASWANDRRVDIEVR